MEKINFYEVRSLGEKIKDSFKLYRQLSHPLLRMFLYIAMPLVIVFSVIEVFFTDYIYTNLLSTYIYYCLSSFIFHFIISAITYGLLKQHLGYSGDTGLDVSLKSFKPTLLYSFKRLGLLYIVEAFALTVFSLLLTGIILLESKATMPLLFILSVLFLIIDTPLTLWPVTYVIEDNTTLLSSLSKSLRYGFRTWFSLFLLLLVISLIVLLAVAVCIIPIYLLELALKAGMLVNVYHILLIVFVIIVLFIILSLVAINYLAIALHYGTVKEMESIDNYYEQEN